MAEAEIVAETIQLAQEAHASELLQFDIDVVNKTCHEAGVEWDRLYKLEQER